MDENPTTDLLNIISKAMDSKMYGSVEVYLENGQITQISQRIIKKVKRGPTVRYSKKGGKAVKTLSDEHLHKSVG